MANKNKAKKGKYVPQVINVIEVISGMVQIPKSFIITKQKDEDKLSKKAEELFAECVRENEEEAEKMTTEEIMDTYGDNYDNTNGYEVMINWSEIQ